MKTLLLAILGIQCAHSAVVVNTGFFLGPGDFGQIPTYQYALTIEQYPPPGASHTSIFFDRSAQNLIYRTMNLDGGSYWYFAMANDSFTPNNIAQGDFILFNQPDQSFQVPYGDFYFGVRTFSDFGENIQGFGWALMNHSAAGLTLLGSAITYDQPGLVIGTTTTVPEPGGMSLLVAALVILTFTRTRNASR
ncbi:MAG: hypothetical protein RLZZ214_1845 [Verrucomicrobiota bacterium]|jgi:hypothetical protein